MAEKAVKKTAKKPAKKAGVSPKATKVARAKTPSSSSDFAVIETGGKQYVVSVGEVITVELLGEHKEGDKIEFDKVLLSDDGKDATIGTPYIKGAKVKGSYVGQKKGPKISILRYKAKSNRDRKVGHRQKYAEVQIDSI